MAFLMLEEFLERKTSGSWLGSMVVEMRSLFFLLRPWRGW